MTINIENLKKKIIYRSTYRGTKEMDKLLTSFTKKYINTLSKIELLHLCDLLDFDDQNLFKFNQGDQISIKIKTNEITKLFKNFRYKAE